MRLACELPHPGNSLYVMFMLLALHLLNLWKAQPEQVSFNGKLNDLLGKVKVERAVIIDT